MDIQNYLKNSMIAMRKESLDKSDQLTISELILKLEAVKNKKLPIAFDSGDIKPSGFGSWRGSYCELAINWDGGSETFYDQPKLNCKKTEYGSHDYKCPCGGSKKTSSQLKQNPTVNDFLKMLNKIVGKYMVGYKGGDFTVGKRTPVWVANHGTSSGFKRGEEGSKEQFYNQAVVDIKENKKFVSIVTELIEY